MYDEKDALIYDEDDSNIVRQLKYFYQKDLEKKFSDKKLYIKAFYLHHLLDFFKETRVEVYDLDLVFKKFLQEKVNAEISDISGKNVSFQKELDELFDLLKKNKQELYDDLQGANLTRSEKKKST